MLPMLSRNLFTFTASVQTQRASESRDIFNMILTRFSCRSWLCVSHHKKGKQTRKMILEIMLINNSILSEHILKCCRQVQNLCRNIMK